MYNMMSRKGDSGCKSITVSVIGLSGTEKEKGQLGVGKSCLCNRFIRSKADDYNVDHISVLSQTDFSGRVVNNDHFLYWGSVNKELDDQDIGFHVVEQTEFVDDACFQPFKAGGKTEPYYKRCAVLRLQSAEKLMYVCKNQLGIEKEYEQKLMPDGRLSVDGFLCVYDVSHCPGRSYEKQSELIAGILVNVLKTKKPVVLVTTKNDEAAERGIREAERLLGSRREWRAAIPIVETSSHLAVNVDHAFLLLAQMIEKSKNRLKVSSYQEALRIRREQLESVTDAFQHLIRAQVTDHRETWAMASRRLGNKPEWLTLVDALGEDALRRALGRHARALRDAKLAARLRIHLSRLPNALRSMRLDTDGLHESDWSRVIRQIRSHPEAGRYFLESDVPWTEDALSGASDDEDEDLQDGSDNGDKTLIPFDVLDTSEAAMVFRSYLQDSHQEQRTIEWGRQFKQLLEETGYVTPGKTLSEVRVLFLGRECFEALSEREQNAIYDQHQRDLHQAAKANFQELLLEHADVFYHLKSISPSGTVTQEDIKEINEVLQDDFRFKIMDKAEQDRKLVLFQHLGFVHCPMKEHCPGTPNCIDIISPSTLSQSLGSLMGESQDGISWDFDPDADNLNLLVLGFQAVTDEVSRRFESNSGGRISCRTAMSIDEHTPNFKPHGCFWVYWDQESFEFIRQAVERNLLSNLEQDEHNQNLPMVIMFVQQSNLDEHDCQQLQDEGQNLSDNVHWAYWDCHLEELGTNSGICNALRHLPRARPARIPLVRPVADSFHADIRIIMSLFCGDPYPLENVLAPLLLHPSCCLTGDSSIIIDTFLGDSKRNIEVIISSYHGANQYREELVHGFILVYSAKRKASLSNLNAFSMNIPNLPIQVVAVAEGAGAFFGSELSQLLLTDGNAAADRLGAHFCTYTPSCHSNSAYYTPFFKEVWEKKAEIERAFHLEEPQNCGLPDVAENRPRPPPRADSYHLNHRSDGYQLPSSLDLLLGSQPDPNSMNHRGFNVYPPPSTPPEPAPPDHRMPHADLSPDLNCSEDSLSTHDSDGGGGWGMINVRAATTGRSRAPPPPRHRHAHTLKQPGKLEMGSYALVTGALQNMSLRPRPPSNRKGHHGSSQGHHGKSTFGHHHHPSGVSSETELDIQYAQIKDTGTSERMLGLALDAQHARAKMRHRREKGQPSFSETDSECSSIEEEIGRSTKRTASSGGMGSVNRNKHHNKGYRKRLVAVPAPRAPRLGVFVGPPELPTGYRGKEGVKDESSDGSGGEGANGPPTRVGAYNLLHNTSQQSAPFSCDLDDQLSSCKESSTQENDLVQGTGNRPRRSGWPRLDRGHNKEWSKSRDSKKSNSSQNASSNSQGWGPQGPNGIPLFLEKCVTFIESEGLNAEGLYRVPGNRAHVDLLFKNFDEDPNISIQQLDIPVNAVATALKDFFSKRLPPLFDDDTMQELEDIASSLGATDRSGRLLALRSLLADRLLIHQRSILKYIFHHFVRVADNSKQNSMDSKNLAICWWPTLLPVQFTDMARFEAVRPYLEDILQTMIDQFPFLFCGQEAAVMV